MKRFALSLTQNYSVAEELAQETMLRGVKHRAKLAAMEDPRPWLFRVTVNLWKDRLRQQQRRPIKQVLSFDIPDQTQSPVGKIESEEQIAEVLELFQQLPDRQRDVLYLKVIEHHPLEDIGQILEMKPANVKTTLSLARKKMRQILRRGEVHE